MPSSYNNFFLVNNKDEERAELEAIAKVEAYCGACGHGGEYHLEMEFNINAASGRPTPEWRTRLNREVEEGKAKKRREYFKKNQKSSLQ
jgi:hypothetical protein